MRADAHCESVETKTLPRLTEAEMKGTDLSVFAKTPYPRWRLDPLSCNLSRAVLISQRHTGRNQGGTDLQIVGA